jgi:hypothetical protein
MEMKIEVTGVRESLATLRKLDPDSRKAAVATLKAAGAPMVQVARLNYPIQPPLSGMGNSGRLQYQPGRVKQQVSISVGGRAPRGANRWPAVTLIQRNAGGAIYSMAGMSNNVHSRAKNAAQEMFSERLQQRYGDGQRGMWKQVKLIRILAQRNMDVAVKQVEILANRRLQS